MEILRSFYISYRFVSLPRPDKHGVYSREYDAPPIRVDLERGREGLGDRDLRHGGLALEPLVGKLAGQEPGPAPGVGDEVAH